MAAPARDVLLLAGRLGAGDACGLRELVARLRAAGVVARVACVGGWAGDGSVECPGLGCSWKLAWAARRAPAGGAGGATRLDPRPRDRDGPRLRWPWPTAGGSPTS